MFMGPRAFQFYFPVIDRFLREHQSVDKYTDGQDWILNGQAWILGMGIVTQLAQRVDDDILPPVASLASFVRENLARYGIEPEDRQRIDEAWQEVQACLQKPKR